MKWFLLVFVCVCVLFGLPFFILDLRVYFRIVYACLRRYNSKCVFVVVCTKWSSPVRCKTLNNLLTTFEQTCILSMDFFLDFSISVSSWWFYWNWSMKLSHWSNNDAKCMRFRLTIDTIYLRHSTSSVLIKYRMFTPLLYTIWNLFEKQMYSFTWAFIVSMIIVDSFLNCFSFYSH